MQALNWEMSSIWVYENEISNESEAPSDVLDDARLLLFDIYSTPCRRLEYLKVS